MISLSYAPSLHAPLSRIDFDNIDALANWLLERPTVEVKEQSPILVPAVFSHYPVAATERTLINAESTSGAFLDFDSGDVTPEEVAEELDAAGIDYLIRPTYSDRPDHRRFCAFIPWSQNLPPDKHKAAVETVIRPRLNGHGTFAQTESDNPVLPRFVCLKPGANNDIVLPDGEPWQRMPIEIDPGTLASISTTPTTYDPMAHLETSPEARQLFRLAIRFIDADAERSDWVAVIGCGLRMHGITIASLQDLNRISDEQWGVIADLEQFSAAGSKGKYLTPENGTGISGCSRKRKNADGEMVPSMVMEHARRCLTGTRMIGLTGVIQRTGDRFPEFEALLLADFPELVEQARSRFSYNLPVEPAVPTEAELAAAVEEAVVRVENSELRRMTYRGRVENVLNVMPFGRAQRLASLIANAGDESAAEFVMNPAAAIVLAAQLINVITAHRAFTKTPTLPPLGGNLYAFYFDRSGSGKSIALGFAERALAKAGYRRAISGSKVHSDSGMYNVLLATGPTLFYTNDEVKSWLSGVAENNANQKNLDSFMLKLWLASCQETIVSHPVRSDDRRGAQVVAPPELRQPNVSFFMLGVPDDRTLFTDTMITSGALARTLCFMPTDEGVALDKARKLAWLEQQRRRCTGEVQEGEHELEEAATMLAEYDTALQAEGLGPSWRTIKTGGGFIQEGGAPINEGQLFRNLSVERAQLDEKSTRWLFPTREAEAAIHRIVDRVANKYIDCDKLTPFISRLREKALRLALSLELFDNPRAKRISAEWMEFAGELIALVEEPWYDKIANQQGELSFKGNKFEKLIPAIKELLDESGQLFNSPKGISASVIKNDKKFSALGIVLRRAAVTSETVRRDAQALLDMLGIAVVPNENGKGKRVFHPAHAPERKDEDDHAD